MSDTLVERLLNWETIYEEDAKKPEGSLYLEAANRIKKLETQLEQTTEALLSIHKALYVETLKQNIKLEEKLKEARRYWYNQGYFDAFMEITEEKKDE